LSEFPGEFLHEYFLARVKGKIDASFCRSAKFFGFPLVESSALSALAPFRAHRWGEFS
jgi:hypothetical protein